MNAVSDSQERPVKIPSGVIGKKFGIRAGAFIIDIVFSGIMNNIMGIFLGLFISTYNILANGEYLEISTSPSIYTIIQILIQLFVYFVAFESYFGGTLGKLLLQMRIINYDGGFCSLNQAISRFLYRLVDGFFFGIVGFLFMKKPHYQRLGDRRSKTLVVNSNDAFIKKKSENGGNYLAYTSISSCIICYSNCFYSVLIKNQIMEFS